MRRTVLLALSIAALFSAACAGNALETRPTSNREFRVEKLFDYDGCTVYRFRDGNVGRGYFSKCAPSLPAPQPAP